MLQIRGDLQGLLYQQDWTAIEFMIRGVAYADKELAISLILWKNKWQDEEQTLLHDILSMPDTDPPLRLLQMVLDMAPEVLFVEDESGNLPLHTAIYSNTHKKGKSMEIIRFLVQCDPERKTLSPITFWQSIRRGGDEEVTRFLLTYSECAQALTMKVNGRVPLYYTSKNVEAISPLLKMMVQATSDELNRRSCCFYQSVENCADYMYDPDAILELAANEKLYCTNHLIDVARRRDTFAAKKKEINDTGETTRMKKEETDDENGEKDDVAAETATEATANDDNGGTDDKETTTPTKEATDENGENATENGAVSPDCSAVSPDKST